MAVMILATVAGADDPAAALAVLRAEPRRPERRDHTLAAEGADRAAAAGDEASYRIAGEIWLLAHRAHRDPADLATALDRLERASRQPGAAGCDAALAVARTHAEFGRLPAGWLAFHRLTRRCPEGVHREAADRALAILGAFRAPADAVAAVDRDPEAPLPALPVRAADAGPPDAGAAADAGPPPADAAPASTRPRGPEKMIIRFSDGGSSR